MDLFKILGIVAIETDDAKSKLDDVTDKAEKSHGKLSSTLGKIGGVLAKGTAVAIGAAATGVAMLTKSAVSNFAEYEQLVGGVKTLFGDSAKSVMEYADNAYKSAGLSANEYMSTVTSFSASLLQSLGGDTEAAVAYADMAITDMSDNANKMGTDMSLIQNAYQGFAKQNYTMLDNLKLGYGGTKEEMQRLLDTANEIQAAQGVMTEYSIDSYADIVEAIHVVQDEMGIYGATADEAKTTIQGSLNSMKSAWKNLIVGIADDSQNLDTLIGNFVESTSIAASNILPRVETILGGIGLLAEKMAPIIGSAIPALIATVLPGMLSAGVSMVESLLQGIQQNLDTLTSGALQIIMMLISSISSMLPQILQMGLQLLVSLINGISSNIEMLIAMAVELVLTLTEGLIENIPMLVDAALVLMEALANGLLKALPTLIAQAPVIVSQLVSSIISNAPRLLLSALEIIVQFVKGLNANLYQVGEACGEIVGALVAGVQGLYSEIIKIGSEVVEQFKQGISNAWSGLVHWFSGLWSSLFGNRSVNVSVNHSGGGMVHGSHASGLDYVPFDGYIAELHKGEMVVPAAEASVLRNGGYADNQQIVTALHAILDAIQEGNSKETVLKLNNREFGRAVRGYANA